MRMEIVMIISRITVVFLVKSMDASSNEINFIVSEVFFMTEKTNLFRPEL